MSADQPWWRRVFGQPSSSQSPPALPAPTKARRTVAAGRARRYESAASGRIAAGWSAPSAGPNSEIDAARATLRDRSRDLARNSPLAQRALTVLTSALVGEGIRPSVSTGDAELDRQLLALWSSLGLDIDTDGRTDAYGMQTLATRAWLESGEVFLRRRWRRPDDGLPVPVQIQILESDLLADTAWRPPHLLPDSRLQYGIVIDGIGRRVAYEMYRAHPGETLSSSASASLETVMVPASEISHVYHSTRPGQLRGVPWLAQVMLDLRDLDDLEHAEIVRQKMQACLAMFRETESLDPETIASRDDVEQDDDGAWIETLRPGMIAKLPPGEVVKFLAPQQFGGFAEAAKHYQRVIAVGSQVPYELLTGDLSQVNYASIRAGDLEFRRLVGVLCRQVVVPHICAPMWRWIIEAGMLSGRLPEMRGAQLTAALSPHWHPPRWIAIDREGEVKADILEIQAGLRTHAQAAAERGGDWRALVEQLAAEKSEAADLGVNLIGFSSLSPSQAVTLADAPRAGKEKSAR